MIKKNLFACQKHYTRTLSARKRRPAPLIRLHQTPIRDVRWQPKGDTPKPEYTCSGLFPDALGSRSAHNLPARGSGAHPGVFAPFFGKKEAPFAPESVFFGKVGIHLPVRKPIPELCPPERGAPPL